MGVGPLARKYAALVLVAWILTLLLPAPAATQGTLLSARAEVTLPPSQGPVPVLLVYSLRPDPGARDVPLSLLTPGATRLERLRTITGDGEFAPSGSVGSAFRLERVRDHYWEGSVRLPPRAGGGPDSTVIQFSYIVEGGWEEGGRATIPLIAPRWVPGEPAPQTFHARVVVPEGFTVTGSFPTSVLTKPPPGEGGSYEVALQGVPALLVLRVVTGQGSILTLERGLNALVILILLIMGIFGVRYLREMKR